MKLLQSPFMNGSRRVEEDAPAGAYPTLTQPFLNIFAGGCEFW
jgi:hypothetical protein